MSAIGDQEKERKERKKARRSDKKARLGNRIEGDVGEEEEAGSEEWRRHGCGEEGARWERAGKVEEKLPVAS